MKLRLSLVGHGRATRDITLSCDATITVGDVARALLRAGAHHDAVLGGIAAERRAPVTLIASPPSGEPGLLLDPASPVIASGLRSGWAIEPAPEFDASRSPARMIEPAGWVDVRSGRHAGARFSLLPGENLVGRDAACRVLLSDPGVSRRHASIVIGDAEAGGGAMIRDLGSVNGVEIDGRLRRRHRFQSPCVVVLGEAVLRIVPAPPAPRPARRLHHSEPHTRSPRVVPRFDGGSRRMPAPPETAADGRIPFVAMIAPAAMGLALYAVTRSPMSLLMVGFAPLMMIGSWLDRRSERRSAHRRACRAFAAAITEERAELGRLRAAETRARRAEAPGLEELAAAVIERGDLLWTRRAAHDAFLELRLGEAARPSRTRIELPPRGACSESDWQALRRLDADFGTISPVPVVERLSRCGALGVAGTGPLAEALLASLVMQLVALHSPVELVLSCFAGPEQVPTWGWLKWLPHVDPVSSPIAAGHLAADPVAAGRLLPALEQVIAERRCAGAGAAASSVSPSLPAVIVVVLETGGVDPARLIALAEQGPAHGVHVLWRADRLRALPAACRSYLEAGIEAVSVGRVDSGEALSLSRAELLDPARAARLARSLASLEDTAARSEDPSDLPPSIALSEIHPCDLLGGAGPILEAWRASDSIKGFWSSGAERHPTPLTAVIGQGSSSTACIDLRLHGPHALVGGTTGSGKSEFLQTWIMSLAVAVSPDQLALLLIDYKGGAAFAECVDLPHTVGLVTDLSPRLVRRVLVSLRAELRAREALLARRGAKDLLALERVSDPETPPSLLIVIDEFAALARDAPEFIDGVVDIAQRGRSLGLHLVLATQRPTGVITDNLRANTNLRIALRMADEADSRDVVGVADAAHFEIGTPGRCALAVGAGRVEHLQAGYLGGRAAHRAAEGRLELRSLSFSEGEPWGLPKDPYGMAGGAGSRTGGSGPRTGAAARRDIERLRDGVVAAAVAARIVAPRRPWLDELPERIELDDLIGLDARAGDGSAPPLHSGAPDRGGAVVGLSDLPHQQAQLPVKIDLATIANAAIIGTSGSGKTTAILTLAAALSVAISVAPAVRPGAPPAGEPAAEPEPAGEPAAGIELYAIDAGGGGLTALRALPGTGAVAALTDPELVTRILVGLRDRISASTADGTCSIRRPPAVLFVDGLSAFRQQFETARATESPWSLLAEVMLRGRPAGVHVIVTADRPGTIPAALETTISRRFVLRLAGLHEYGLLGVPSETLRGAVPGRGVIDGEEMQFARFGSDEKDRQRRFERLAAALRLRGAVSTPRMRNAPTEVRLAELPATIDGRPVIGIDTGTFAPIAMPVRGLGVVSGPSGSGTSTALLCAATAFSRWSAEQGAASETVLLSGTDAGMRPRFAWDRIARHEEEIVTLARGLVDDLVRGEPDGDPAGGRARRLILIERSADIDSTRAASALTALARAARRGGALVLFEFEPGTAGAIWELFGVLRQANWGIALQPDAGETQTPFREGFGNARRAEFPVGRGFAVEAGRATPVQLALPGG